MSGFRERVWWFSAANWKSLKTVLDSKSGVSNKVHQPFNGRIRFDFWKPWQHLLLSENLKAKSSFLIQKLNNFKLQKIFWYLEMPTRAVVASGHYRIVWQEFVRFISEAGYMSRKRSLANRVLLKSHLNQMIWCSQIVFNQNFQI